MIKFIGIQCLLKIKNTYLVNFAGIVYLFKLRCAISLFDRLRCLAVFSRLYQSETGGVA